jgi:hypothetical protein
MIANPANPESTGAIPRPRPRNHGKSRVGPTTTIGETRPSVAKPPSKPADRAAHRLPVRQATTEKCRQPITPNIVMHSVPTTWDRAAGWPWTPLQ